MLAPVTDLARWKTAHSRPAGDRLLLMESGGRGRHARQRRCSIHADFSVAAHHAAHDDGGVRWRSRSQSDFSHLPRIIGRIISECNDGEVQN